MEIRTKEQFDNLIDRIKNKVSLYEANGNHYNQYQMYLANGKKLTFEIKPQNIAHLLGIQFDYLKSSRLFKGKDAYEILKEFLERSYFVYDHVQKRHLAYNAMFSDYMETKLESFEKIIYYFSLDEIEFICNYDKSKTYKLNFEKDYPCDYFIAKKDSHGNIHLLGLINEENRYIPMSNITFLEGDEQISNLDGLLQNQILTYPNSILIANPVTNFNKSHHLYTKNKLEKIKTLKNYTTLVPSVSIDVSTDHQFVINGYLQKEQKLNAYKEKIGQLKEAILKRELLAIEQEDDLEIDEEIIAIINAYNNDICNKENTSAKTTYSNLVQEHQLLSQKVEDLLEQLKNANAKLELYAKQIKELEQENSEYQEFQEDIFDVVMRKREKIKE